MSGSSKSGKSTRRYSEELMRDAVGLVAEQVYSMADVARGLGVHFNLIPYWRLVFLLDGAAAIHGPTLSGAPVLAESAGFPPVRFRSTAS
ncbi:MAG: transposase [Planctomycetaceae bacterium]